jgi:chromatin segregation and condensation protein Rec8/ScpA/Scc1 (kleisin family)
MQNVKVNKKDLLAVLKTNREKHLIEFNSASKIFIQDAIEKLTEMLTQAKTKNKIIQSLGLVEPVSYVHSYDTAVKMLEMSIEDVIELSQQEFTQYVEDSWGWKQSFMTTTSFYNNKVQ